MTKERLDGLYLLLLGAAICILLGGTLEAIAPVKMSDFRAVYDGARCMIHHRDPYKSSEILREFEADGGQFPANQAIARPVRRAILVCINLPSSLMLVVPFAFLPWELSHMLWLIFSMASLVLAAYFMWDHASAFSPVLGGALIAMILANSEALLINGNAAGVAIGLGLAGIWCFVKNRFQTLGVCCLAISLAFKPHDIGFVWLYLLLAGGAFRKYALKSLLMAILICVPAMLWMSHLAPGWIQELRSNLIETSARGDLNDPGPTSMGAHTVGMEVNLQSAISLVRDEPDFYNPVTYLLIGPLILVWAVVTLRSRFSVRNMWMALAAISSLSLLPVYHRIYDAKLLLLSVPACAMLWTEGGLISWLTIGMNTLALILTSDLTWMILSILLGHVRIAMPWLPHSVLNALIAFPAPTTLLLMSTLYLWIYAREDSIGTSPDIEMDNANQL